MKQKNEFEININCTSDLLFPLPFFSGKGYDVSVTVSGKGWMRGNIGERKKEEFSVWMLDNLNRGKKIEKHFGSNLPYDYPVIDIYDKSSGRITLIRSIDHTTDTYMRTENFTKTLESELKRIMSFKGTYYNDNVSEEFKIRESDIKYRKILLIVPENKMTMAHSTALIEFFKKCTTNNVEFEYKVYQVSP